MGTATDFEIDCEELKDKARQMVEDGLKGNVGDLDEVYKLVTNLLVYVHSLEATVAINDFEISELKQNCNEYRERTGR